MYERIRRRLIQIINNSELNELQVNRKDSLLK